MQRLTLLDDDNDLFPDISDALVEPNGLLAVGGDLSSSRLLTAYRRGIFPWYDEGQPILWWSPDPRCVIEPQHFKPSRSLARKIARAEFEIKIDHDFDSVIAACRLRDGEEGTWITKDMMQAYIDLHEAGVAHSVECYADGDLVGGLYGLSMGRLFFGESMFHKVTDASKVAFAALMEVMNLEACPLVDCQIANPHLFSLGANEIPRQEFQSILRENIDKPPIDWHVYKGKSILSNERTVG